MGGGQTYVDRIRRMCLGRDFVFYVYAMTPHLKDIDYLLPNGPVLFQSHVPNDLLFSANSAVSQKMDPDWIDNGEFEFSLFLTRTFYLQICT